MPGTVSRARLTLLFALALPATALLSCADKETPRERKELEPDPRGDGGGLEEQSRGREAIRNQSQAAQVLLTANGAEIREAKVAVDRASEPDVKAFAEEIVRDHTAARDRLKGIIEKNGIEPEVTPTSDRIKFDSDSAMNHLSQMTESMFDRAFVTRQINVHKSLLSLIDQEIVPVVVDADLRREVGKERAAMQQHLEHAEDIMERLPSGTPPDPPDAGDGGDADAGVEDSGGGSPIGPGTSPDAGAL